MEEYWNEDWELELNEDLRKRRERGRKGGEKNQLTLLVSSVLSSHLCDAGGEFPSSSL